MFNQVILMGRLVKDPEIRYAQGADGAFATCRVSIAVDRPQQKGKDKPGADFIQLAATGILAENMGKYLEKGCRVHVSGRWRHEVYTKKDGTNGYLDECKVESMKFIDFKKTEPSPQPSNDEFAAVEYPDDLPFA